MERSIRIHFGHAEFFPTKEELEYGTDWTCVSKSKPGDIALLYFHEPKSRIEVIGRVLENPYKGVGSPKWAKPGKLYYFTELGDLAVLSKPITLYQIRAAFPSWGVWKNISGRNVVSVPPKLEKKLIGLLVHENPGVRDYLADKSPIVPVDPQLKNVMKKTYEEPQVREHAMEKFYGTPQLVKDAKRFRGVTCEACGFNFEKQYGSLGDGFIEVHHIKPLSSYKGSKPVMVSLRQVRVVCSNCHSMIHKSKIPLTLSKVKVAIREADKGVI